MDFAPLLEHPDKDEIISRILNGVDPKEVHAWLKSKYPDEKSRRMVLTTKLLQEFVKSNYTNYYDKFSRDLTAMKDGKITDTRLAESLMNNRTYQERLAEYAGKKVDVEESLNNLIKIATDRAIQVFDQIQNNPFSTKGDYALIKWFELIFNGLEKLQNYNNHSSEQIINNNYTIQYIDQTNAIFQNVIRKMLSELDPETSLKMMDMMNREFQAVKAIPMETTQTVDQTLSEIKTLADSFK